MADEPPGQPAKPAATAAAAARDVFVSYASQDAAIATAIVEALENAGLRCWIAPRDVVPGSLYADEIVGAINDAAMVVLILSERAVASAHVGKEIERASSKRRRIVAVRTDSAPLTKAFEYFLSESQWIDLGGGDIDAAASKLVAAVRRHLDPSAAVESVAQSGAVTVRPRAVAQRTKWIAAAGVAILSLALGYLLLDKYWLSKRPANGPAVPAATTAIAERSIAVLPFVDMSEKRDQEYFADGISEEILDLLVKLPGLRVIGRTSSFQFKGKSQDLRAIGSTLGASYLVEGSVRRSGDRLRVTAQLVGSQDGSPLWSETYDRDFGDVLMLEGQIATEIARALQLTISASDARPLRGARATEAYMLYLKGKVALDSFNTNSLAEAQGAFEQALSLDPSLVPAAEGIALAWMQRGHDENDIPALEGWNKARTAAHHVLAMDASSAIAHVILGAVAAFRDFDWPTADAEFRSAFAKNPNDPNALEQYAQILWGRGRLDEGVRRTNAFLALDPLNSLAWQDLALVLYLKQDHVAAASAIRKSLAIDPRIDYCHYLLGVIHLLHGRAEDALKEFPAEQMLTNRYAGAALVNHALGKHAASDSALASLIREGSAIWPYGIATTYAYRGEKEKAFEWLEKAYEARDSDLLTLGLADPLLLPLHADPRWAALLRKMNLPE